MAKTGTKMGLKIWDLSSDLYDHTQLADNLFKIEYHDHSPGRGVQVPTEGIADGAITPSKLTSSIDPSGAYSSYKYVHGGTTNITTSSPGWVYSIPGGTPINPGAGNLSAGIFPIFINTTNYDVTGRTTFFKLATSILTGSTSGSNFTVGLYSATTWALSGGAPTVLVNPTPVGSAAYTAIASSSQTVVDSADFTLTSGWYVLGVLSSTAQTFSVQARLMVRQV